ncbi:MAG: zinc-ribbon domain-containing protein [Acidobacteriota bacterium]|nr:zinc-ribbon domain-containing protein [Acidobacteriota bacterium]
MAQRILIETKLCYRRAALIIECPSCHSKYQYDAERFERKPSKKIKCARCQQIFEIHNPAFAAPEPAKGEGTDATYAKRATSISTPVPAQHDATEQSPLPVSGRSDALQLPAGKRLSLAILDGPDAGNVFRIEKPRITIGRANADLTLNDSEASRQHAAVEIRDTTYKLTDLGSTNGTLFEGSKIEGEVELSDKAEFQIGSTTLMLIVTVEG